MMRSLKPLLVLLQFFIFRQAFAVDDEINKKDIKWWCSTMPHPEPCKHFLQDFPSPKSDGDFRIMTIRAAMEQAVSARAQARQIRCRTKRTEAVNRDCNDLIDSTIAQLNTTLETFLMNASSTYYDIQTWLSAALTNIEICRSGSQDLNVTGFTSPVLSGNVSQLISNCLATNGRDFMGNSSSMTSYRGRGLPEWVSKGDRKLLHRRKLAIRADVVVALDGSGAFRSIQAAVNYATARRKGNGRVVVYVKRGVYRENVVIGRTMNKVMLVGDGMRSTVITGSRSVKAGYTTYSTATVGIDGIGFIARGITFRNTAGPAAGQAVAFRSASDLSVYYSCGFEGYQDTLFVHTQRQFYKNCYIYGTIDFIFGNAAVVFQSCVIAARRPLVGQANVITAQGRGDPFQNTGISIQGCRIVAAPDLLPVVASVRTYLGRPWQQYSRTVIMKSFLDRLVSPDGWSPWQNSNFAQTTLYYGEYRNIGPGGSTAKRVRWPGYHVIRNPNEAARFTVGSFIAGRGWLPSTGIPFTVGL